MGAFEADQGGHGGLPAGVAVLVGQLVAAGEGAGDQREQHRDHGASVASSARVSSPVRAKSSIEVRVPSGSTKDTPPTDSGCRA